MKFIMIVGHADNADSSWREEDNRPELETEEQVRAWANEVIARFNATLRPYEKARALRGIEFDAGSAVAPHRWVKKSLVTQTDSQRGMFDLVECVHCGCVARRYGLSRIKRQKPYTAMKWNSCPGATN